MKLKIKLTKEGKAPEVIKAECNAFVGMIITQGEEQTAVEVHTKGGSANPEKLAIELAAASASAVVDVLKKADSEYAGDILKRCRDIVDKIFGSYMADQVEKAGNKLLNREDVPDHVKDLVSELLDLSRRVAGGEEDV